MREPRGEIWRPDGEWNGRGDERISGPRHGTEGYDAIGKNERNRREEAHYGWLIENTGSTRARVTSV